VSFFCDLNGSFLTFFLIWETTENVSAYDGYNFGHEEETYIIVAAHGFFGRFIFQYSIFNNSRSLHFFLAAWPVVARRSCSLALDNNPAAMSPVSRDCTGREVCLSRARTTTAGRQ